MHHAPTQIFNMAEDISPHIHMHIKLSCVHTHICDFTVGKMCSMRRRGVSPKGDYGYCNSLNAILGQTKRRM